MPGEAVDEVVLAPVRLIRDDNDIPPLREHGVAVSLGSIALLGRKELLNRGEDHAARSDRELGTQISAIRGLHRRLAQQLPAACEGCEKLVVEVVAVGEHDEGRVLHQWMQNHAT